MNPIPIILCILLAAAGVFAWSLVASRAGKGAKHDRAFYSGLLGLLAIPAWLAAFAGMALQLFWATFASPAGVLFIASSLLVLACLGVSIASLAGLRRARVAR